MRYEQEELDLRLDFQKSLKDNLINVAQFTEQKMKEDYADAGRPLHTVENKQEAYGVAAGAYVNVSQSAKILKGTMEDFLKLLNAEGEEVTSIVGNIHSAAIELADTSIQMAAHARRILADLYYTQPKTPIEEYLEAGEINDDNEGDDE